jgi:hypothetical protein
VETLERLERDGLLRREGASWRTTRRWQGAMARAALRLLGSGDDGRDLRVPVAAALVELYEDEPDVEIVRLIEAITPIEARELQPNRGDE